VQQVDSGHPGTGADLDDRLGVGGPGQQPQGGPGAGGDGTQTRLAGPGTGAYQRVVLGDESVRERPARLPVAGNGPRSCPLRSWFFMRTAWRLYPLS
jgi:hypothetical protein